MGKRLHEAGFRHSRLVRVILRYMPKIGPFKALAFNNPTRADRRHVLQEHQYDASTNTAFISSKFARDRWNSPTLILTLAKKPKQRNIL